MVIAEGEFNPALTFDHTLEVVEVPVKVLIPIRKIVLVVGDVIYKLAKHVLSNEVP